jgi:hypothetical protein
MSNVETFITALRSHDDNDAKSFALAVVQEFDTRIAYENTKNSENDNIVKTLNKSSAKLASVSAARVMMTCNVAASFINRAERVNAKYNVYASEKLADIIASLRDARCFTNAINNAIVRSMLKCDAAKIAFTHKLAIASASDKVNVDATMRKHLVRHTVSVSTASTQASSTMNALVTANICEEYRDDSNNVAYRLRDNVQVAALREIYAK